MAFDAKPSTWFGAGYAYASDAISFGTSTNANPTLTQLTNAEANATTGDVREVMRALCYKFSAVWDATAAADRPGQMTISKQISYDSDGTANENYVFTFNVGVTYGNVSTE
jgi:hypothetical protein